MLGCLVPDSKAGYTMAQVEGPAPYLDKLGILFSEVTLQLHLH